MSDPAPPDTMPDAPPDAPLPPSLRFLKGLVIVLTLTMIGGVITVVGVIVTRMPQAFQSITPSLPDGIALPQRAKAVAVTFGIGWIAVVTEDDRILIFDADGSLRQEVALTP